MNIRPLLSIFSLTVAVSTVFMTVNASELEQVGGFKTGKMPILAKAAVLARTEAQVAVKTAEAAVVALTDIVNKAEKSVKIATAKEARAAEAVKAARERKSISVKTFEPVLVAATDSKLDAIVEYRTVKAALEIASAAVWEAKMALAKVETAMSETAIAETSGRAIEAAKKAVMARVSIAVEEASIAKKIVKGSPGSVVGRMATITD